MPLRKWFYVQLLFVPCRSLAQLRAERDSSPCVDEDEEETSDYFNESFDSPGGGELENVHFEDWEEEEVEGKGEVKEGEEEKEEEEEEEEVEGNGEGTEWEEKEEEEEEEKEVEGNGESKEGEEEEGQEVEEKEGDGKGEEREEDDEKKQGEIEGEGQGEENEEEEEKVVEEREGRECNEDVDDESVSQVTSNESSNFPYMDHTVDLSQTVLQSPAHSDGKSSYVTPFIDSPTHSTSSLSDGGKHSAAPYCAPRLGTPSSAQWGGAKKSPMAHYQAMAAQILSSASKESTVSETEQVPTMDMTPPPVNVSLHVEEAQEVTEVQKHSKRKKTKKAIRLAAQFGDPPPQVATPGHKPAPALPLQATTGPGCGPKQSVRRESSPLSSLSSQGSGKLAAKPHPSNSASCSTVQAAEGVAVSSTSDGSEGEDEEDGGKRQWAKWQCQLTALKVTCSARIAPMDCVAYAPIVCVCMSVCVCVCVCVCLHECVCVFECVLLWVVWVSDCA